MKNKFLHFDIFQSLPSEVFVTVIVAFFLLHVILLVSICFFKKQIHPMYLLFLVISSLFYVLPFDVLTVSEAGRWLRVYLLVITAVIGLLFYRPKRLGPLAKIALLYAVFMVINAAKTADAAAYVGIVYKMIFLIGLIAFLCIAHSVRDPKQLFKQFHWFVGLMAIYAVYYVVHMGTNPATLAGERLAYGNVITVSLACSLASVLVICVFVVMYDASRVWKIFGIFVVGAMGLVILYTGTRGATFSLILAFSCMAIPLIKRPGTLIFIMLLIAVGSILVIHSNMETTSIERALGIRDVTQDRSWDDITTGRLEIWQNNLVGFYQHPILGCGFMETGIKGGGGFHTSYIQVLSEGGVVGASIFMVFCVMLLQNMFYVFIKGKKCDGVGNLRILPIGCLMFAALHGISESSLMYSTNMPAAILMLGIGYLDWMYLAVRQPQYARGAVLARGKVCRQLPCSSV